MERMNFDASFAHSRRQVLRGLGAVLITGTGVLPCSIARSQPTFGDNPFTLGVASGDPTADGFVLWTKIAPKPLERGGGMSKDPVEVSWVVAGDETMKQIVQRGTAVAHPELGHAVHVEVAGLQAARDYFYRFSFGGHNSPVGRSRTLPAAGTALTQLRFAAAGCQRYEAGYYTAYRHIAEERFDFVFHYGDYIYEYTTVKPGALAYPVIRVMPDEPGECFSLDDYRHRYALYRLDADLQAAHASAPFIMSFDDHEVANNFAGNVSPKMVSSEAFLRRRAAAFQAWYEHLPVRRAQLPKGPDILMYRRFVIGDLLTMNVLDTRQYRTSQACGDGVKANCKEAFEPHRTMLGDAQERWLYESFRFPVGRWTLLAQQVPMMRMDRDPDPAIMSLPMDKWDGATAARDRLFAAVESAKLRNLIVADGDVHFNSAGELKKNFADEKSPTLGVEFVATSISSLGDGYDTNKRHALLMEQDPHIRFYNGQRGYVRHIVTSKRWQADYRVLDKVSVANGSVTTRKSFVVEDGVSRLMDA